MNQTYRIIIDSAGEIPQDLKDDDRFVSVPLTLDIGGEYIVDDGHVSQADLVRRIAAASECPKSACPSPGLYLDAFEETEADRIYVITISAALSGSYQSANAARQMYEEEHEDVKIHIFNSRTTSVGETLILLRIKEMEEEGYAFEEIISEIEAYISRQQTYFVLDDLETLHKNGRLTGLKYLAVSVLNIKLICGSTPEGEIQQMAISRGMRQALSRMAEMAAQAIKSGTNRIGISYCNCLKRAESLKALLAPKLPGVEILLHEAGGLSSMYANDGGVILVV